MITHPTNSDRAQWAENALNTFTKEVFFSDFEETSIGEGVDTIVSDFLTNLIHLCDKHELDFDALLNRARLHHEAEVSDELDDSLIGSNESETVGEPEREIYLTNGCGESTGAESAVLYAGLAISEDGEYPLTEAECKQIAEEVFFPTTASAWLGLYTTLIGNRKFHSPTLEIEYNHDWWGEDAHLYPSEHAVRCEAERIKAAMAPIAKEKSGEVLIEDEMPGRINVRFRYPLSGE